MATTMAHRKKYFVLNKESDFKRGHGSRIRITRDGILPDEHAAEGVYYTRIFDSRERGMVWHRMCLTGEMQGEASCTVSVYASDSLILTGGQTVEQTIFDGSLTQEQKDCMLAEFFRAEYNIPEDVLLFSAEGRYLWLKIVLRAQAEQIPRISRVQLYFPKHTWLSYLPELYSYDGESASFLERYLGIFQSLYEDMTEQIEGTYGLLKPSAKENDMLFELADWLSIEKKELWNEKQLLYLVKHARRIRAGRGTASCLTELVHLYTETPVFLVEYHQIRPFFDSGKRERLLKRLYTAHQWEFALLTSWKDRGEEHSLTVLRQIIDMAKPAHMECRIILLRPCLFLDQHSYLGINSVLGQYQPLCLDGLCEIPFSVIGEKYRKADDMHEKSELFSL